MQYFVEACHRINKKHGKKCFWARIEDIMSNPRNISKYRCAWDRADLVLTVGVDYVNLHFRS